MVRDHNYQIFADAPKPVREVKFELKDAKGINPGIGCLVWGVIWATFVVIVGYWYCGPKFCGGPDDTTLGTPISAFGGILLASIVTAAIHFFLKWENLSQLEQHHNYQAEKNELTRVSEEAASATSELRNMYESSIKLGDKCCEHIVQALSWLKQAEGEYEENAPFPYWDAIEYSMQHLNSYEEKLFQLSEYAESYYQKLRNRKHNFPLFPVTIDTIPDASPVITELRRVVRLGHTNRHFTNILGHRRTQQALIAGFSETVNNLSEAIRESISDLSESVSSNIGMLADEELKGREVLAHTLEKQDKRLLELNRMVDNIQHSRKPSFRDRPSKK